MNTIPQNAILEFLDSPTSEEVDVARARVASLEREKSELIVRRIIAKNKSKIAEIEESFQPVLARQPGRWTSPLFRKHKLTC